MRLLDTVASATLEERTLTDTYESRIRELEAENADLMKGVHTTTITTTTATATTVMAANGGGGGQKTQT